MVYKNDGKDTKMTCMDLILKPIFARKKGCPRMGFLKAIPSSLALPAAGEYMIYEFSPFQEYL